jgi:hypothetical protein
MVNFGEASTYFGVVETNYIEKKEATRLYQEALKSPKSMKDFDNWIDNWEQGMNMAQRKKVADNTISFGLVQ